MKLKKAKIQSNGFKLHGQVALSNTAFILSLPIHFDTENFHVKVRLRLPKFVKITLTRYQAEKCSIIRKIMSCVEGDISDCQLKVNNGACRGLKI